jgi:DNA-directed RNA polymerase specialized sigma24 family protein
MFGALRRRKKTTDQEATLYATRADFCLIFETDMNRLYLLSFLLTGEHSLAEKCFVGGLHMSQAGNPVFKEWAESWARRSIIMNAIRMIRPRLTDASVPSGSKDSLLHGTERDEIAALVELPPLERFVFVMSVLERISNHECSLLLSCTRRDVIEARTRALQRTGSAEELRHKVVSIAADRKALRADLGSVLRQDLFPGLATSA